MSTTTSSAVLALAAIKDGEETARWNFPDAVGTPTNTPGGVGNAVTVTYRFLDAAPDYDPNASFQAFTNPQQQTTRGVLASIANVTNITFQEVFTGASDISYGFNDQLSTQGGYAFFPAFAYSFNNTSIVSVTRDQQAGDVWLNGPAYAALPDFLPGDEAYITLLHETGHALGLKHPFEATTHGFRLTTALDNVAHTVMAYDPAPHASLITVTGTEQAFDYSIFTLKPSTLMPLDIAALQFLYGANATTHAGDDTYQWSENAELLETIWDTGGTDLIDCSNQSLRCVINLQAGGYSSIALRQTDAQLRFALELPAFFLESLPVDIYNGSNNLAIASGVTIEDAKGGSANDSLVGNAVANVLEGFGGNDTLDGKGGADTLRGGSGNDTYFVDTAGDRVTELLDAGTDELRTSVNFTLPANVENGRTSSTGAVNLTGNGLANALTGGAGNNSLKGAAGNDLLAGGGGLDVLSGGAGKDLFRFDTVPNASTNRDSIGDFSVVDDGFQLENSVFSALKTTGTLAAGMLRAGAGFTSAADANDYLIYNKSSGALYYDADGNAAARKAILFALLSPGLALTHADFLIT